MGLDNREYIREEQKRYSQGGGGFGFGQGGGAPSGPMSMTMIIIIICCVIFLVDAFTIDTTVADKNALGRLNRFLALKVDSLWQVWTFLTYGFAHASFNSEISIFHVGGNMLALFFLGRVVEQRMGRQEYLNFYLVAIVVSGIAFALSALLSGSPTKLCVGASGAVTAVVALFIFMYPKVTILMFFVIPMPAWVLGVLLVGMDLIRAFQPDTVVAWEAHLAGAAFGCAYFYFGWNFKWMKLARLNPFTRENRLRIHNPDAKFETLKAEADRILAKINEEGEESLTGRERRTLNRYSKELRNRRD